MTFKTGLFGQNIKKKNNFTKNNQKRNKKIAMLNKNKAKKNLYDRHTEYT